MTSISDLRREYASRALVESEAEDDALRQFELWFNEALAASLMEANAMTLATVSPGGEPSARIVLLKAFDERGFVFFTNYESAKGRDLEANRRACLLFFWAELERQIRITGSARRVSAEESTVYFHSRPFESQVGAWASHQSRVLPNRSALDEQYAVLLEKHRGQEVPLPTYWGGYRVAPEQIEFWQGRTSRLHDRLLYTRQSNGTWSRVRLAP
jgi:pyridoxamine 5'-phosphate oxidase